MKMRDRAVVTGDGKCPAGQPAGADTHGFWTASLQVAGEAERSTGCPRAHELLADAFVDHAANTCTTEAVEN